jgi:putative nucleotidyltransferase with HDIG domain
MKKPQRYYVGSGSYYVGESQPLILEAALGTCVGLAIWDQEAGIGGLCDLLLSEPRAREGELQPEKYATTGLPIFMKELLAAGATPQNLKASIAGGALVGPLEDFDLDLDIGGRTVERVLEFLANKNINIVASETGGVFTCTLSLNLQTWACGIAPAGFGRHTADAHLRLPTSEEINRAMKTLRPIPQVALKMLRIINEDSYDIATLTEEIRKDQVLSARTLKLCNSVYFGSRNKIESLDHALVYLGQALLLKLVISASINNFFHQAAQGYSLCKGGMYHHAVGTAIIAEKIAGLTGYVNAPAAYTAGLLHDIGKVVLDQYIQFAFPLFYRELQEKEKNFLDVETELLGVNHAEVGTKLAHQWSFPDSLTETIRHHHKPEDSTQYHELVHIVYLADLLMSRFHAGLEVERLDMDALNTRMQTLGLSITRFEEIVDIIPLKVLESSPEMALMDGK